MPRELKLYLWDILQAGELIQQWTDGKTFDDYLADEMLRSAVERKFGVIGEALNVAGTLSPDVRDKITDHRQVVAFRNRVIHGYFVIDDKIVWTSAKDMLPVLLAETRRYYEALLP